MSGMFGALKRMVSFSRSREQVPQVDKDGVAKDAPAASAKSGKRKYSSSDDEGEPSLSKRPKQDATEPPAVAEDGSLAEPQPGESSAVDHAPAEPEATSTPEPEQAAEPASDEVAQPAATAAADDAEEEPKPAPDTPEPESKAEDDSPLPTLDETSPNSLLSWTDGLIYLFEAIDAEPPVLWLKSQILAAYKDASTDAPPEEMEYVGYWGVEIDDDARETALAKAFVANWIKARAGTTSDDTWWWELTLVRDEPSDDTTPRIKANLESSTHNEDHEVAGGKQLGEWWITAIQPASEDAANVMTMHRALY
ncbi:hypothetical protein EXIGLDRAFT_735499 [Exidia glandulosa HHB12029]|uniref:Uncharacterized protein n=1 Tax=Exidia glandulosa HHB12029 TaxID=1314781 RepID=A0A166NHU4_EXIGL|nr:hypothetical protein EXIGLDRAFT_735499 [Exidia glandulosa HHB12029]